MTPEQYSSFAIAKLLRVSRQAVNQWIDKGYMISYRTPGGHRRVSRHDLIAFLNDRGIPIPPDLRADGATDLPANEKPYILLVDDDTDFSSVVRQAILERIPQARVAQINNGYDGLLSIGRERPDLLVLDLKMPKLDGEEVCRRLKQNPHTSSLPIIILTAYETEERREVLKRLGIQDVFPKSTSVLEIAVHAAKSVKSRTAPLAATA